MRFVMALFLLGSLAHAECDREIEALNRYEYEILQAAQSGQIKKMAAPLACILQMQNEDEDIARYLANSYLRPLIGGPQIAGVLKDARYKTVAQAMEQLTLRASDPVRASFVSEFSKGDWRFYTLFCEQGNTDFCSIFLPDDAKVKDEPPLVAAASMLRLRKAYQVLDGEQRLEVGSRLKKLHRDIPKSDKLKRKFIDEIYRELFDSSRPLSLLG